MSSVHHGDPGHLMQKWLERKEDFVISCGKEELVQPWKFWINKVLDQTVKNKTDVPESDGPLLTPPPRPQPLTIFLFPTGTDMNEDKVLSEAWGLCSNVMRHYRVLLQDVHYVERSLRKGGLNKSLEVLFTTPPIYKYLLEKELVGSSLIQILVFYKVEDEMDDQLITYLDQQLCPPQSRSSIMITDSFGSNARAVAQILLKPTHHRIFLPFWSNNRMNSARRPELLAWIKGRPKGEKILVLSVGTLDANMFAQPGNLSSDGKNIISAMRYSCEPERSKVFRKFNNGTSTVLSIVKEDIDEVDLNEVDVVVIFDFTPDVYLVSFNSSPLGIFQDPKRVYKTLFVQ